MATLYQRPQDGDRLWVGIVVTQADIDRGRVDARRPGLMLFTGMWYGRDPLTPASYGKMLPPNGFKPVGRVSRRSGQSTLRRLGFSGAKLNREAA